MRVVFVAPLAWDALCKRQFPTPASSPTYRFCCPARCEMEGLLVLVKKKKKKRGRLRGRGEKKKVCFITFSAPRWPSVAAVLSLWSRAVWGEGEMIRGLQRAAAAASSSSPQLPVAPSLSRLPVTEPHAVEQRPLPDSANYGDPLRGNKRNRNRWENRGVFTRLFSERRDEHCWYWWEFLCLWSKETL